MKAIEILELLESNSVFPRGLSVLSGQICKNSLKPHANKILIAKGNFLDDEKYLKLTEGCVPQSIWDAVKNCEVEVNLNFANYRYLRIE